ncbi:MAG: hypothetical protein V1806_08365 [Pseudomonadota bacterium]
MAEQAQRHFCRVEVRGTPLWDLCTVPPPTPLADLTETLKVLDYLHIEAGLLSAYHADYPLVEPRELIPPFDAPLIEYKHLPAFSMVLLDRQLSYQDEGFQFDLLLPEGLPTDPSLAAQNRALIRDRLPRNQLADFEQTLGRRAVTRFSRYNQLLPHLFKMDRGHVLARDPEGAMHLAGIFASFPSDLDGEIKRYGQRLGKFSQGDNDLYAANRLFVYRFLMEQSGFAICGERHTSAALFARRLLRRRERFAVKVLGNSDRTITTLCSLGAKGGLPQVEKVALVAAQCERKEADRLLSEQGFFVDPARKVLILRVHYAQHAYHPDNVLEDRALSVLRQEVVHPQSGRILELDVLGLGQDRLLMLNDIVRGEFHGSIVYKGRERVEGSGDIKTRLKCLAAWLLKHRPIVAEYSPDHFERVTRILTSFLDDPSLDDDLAKLPELRQEVVKALADLRMSHRLRLLEKLVQNRADASGRKLKLAHVLTILVHVLEQEGQDLVLHHPRSLRKLLRICRKQLADRDLQRRFLRGGGKNLYEREIMSEYRQLKHLVEQYEGQGPPQDLLQPAGQAAV